ncbi:ABC transport system [Cutibacterium acnes JCM 18909]|nr:ABC transport system [Cutibacterium acnes JCM 18909]
MRRWLPSFLLVLPSIILVGVFVYGFIGKTVFASLARVKTKSGRVKAPGGWANYSQLLADGRYQHAMWNLLVLTVVFVAGTMVFGLLWALLLEKGVTGEGFFRSIFLFPMAVSFVAAGVIWRWLLSPAKDGQATGLNQLFLFIWECPGYSHPGIRRGSSIWRLWPSRLSGSCPAISWLSSWPVSAVFPKTSVRQLGSTVRPRSSSTGTFSSRSSRRSL